jgi:hypothetical protein
MEMFLYDKYFKENIVLSLKKYKKLRLITVDDTYLLMKKTTIEIKKADQIRLKNSEVILHMNVTFEHTLMHMSDIMTNALQNIMTNTNTTTKNNLQNTVHTTIIDTNTDTDELQLLYNYYTLLHIKSSTIVNTNKYVLYYINKILLIVSTLFTNISERCYLYSHHIIEKNNNILHYNDLTLYVHQKELFQIFSKMNESVPTLVLYTSPTGSGKTLSPIGLSTGYHIIYICAARHVGISLARSCISIGKRVAFAFGCTAANDIRLHYSAAVDYTVNKKSGGIKKVDNDNGSRVEIMICDIESYLIAMYYMLSFFPETNIILFWDEPTISLDVANHELHSIISNIWQKNTITKIILSSATLPNIEKIRDVVDDFRSTFDNSQYFTISSHDYKKTINILDSKGYSIVPHTLFSTHDLIVESMKHCQSNLSLLRYIDLRQILLFSVYVEKNNILEKRYTVKEYFLHSSTITLMDIKLYYLYIIKHISPDQWSQLYTSLQLHRISIYDELPLKKKSTLSNSGMLLTTEHAHTLTDGPTIFLTDKITDIGQFLFENTSIDKNCITKLLNVINSNEKIRLKIEELNKTLDDQVGTDDKKMSKEIYTTSIKKTLQHIDELQNTVQPLSINNIYIPNSLSHQDTWLHTRQLNSFLVLMEESIIIRVMQINISTQAKLLLLLGIGLFEKETYDNTIYLELIKELTEQQKIFIIIASSDYIYGTNYQFCHGFIGKDLVLSQEKIIQSFGRIGRGNIQQDYTIRLRDDKICRTLFLPDAENIEAINMSRLFVRNVM